MRIDELRLFQFRNFTEKTLTLCPRINSILGRNGQGKTNLVEAVHFLSLTKSFRTNTLSDLVYHGKKESSVFAKVSGNSGETELGISIESGKRKVYINGDKAASISDYLGSLYCVSFSPTDISLVKDSPQGRRAFIDRHMVDVGRIQLEDLMHYQRAIKSKSALLRSGPVDPEIIRTWNQIIIESGAKIVSARLEFLSDLESLAKVVYAEVAPEDAPLSMSLKSSFVSDGSTCSIDELHQQFEASIEREISQRSALLGPHRDEIVISLGGLSARSFASQGQSRSIVLAMKLAVISMIENHCGESPVVLLDDVDSELDESRRRAFFSKMAESNWQVFLTGTELDLNKEWGIETGATFQISGGEVETLSTMRVANA